MHVRKKLELGIAKMSAINNKPLGFTSTKDSSWFFNRDNINQAAHKYQD